MAAIAPVLIDTCAAIWLMAGDAMAPAALKRIAEAQAAGGVYVSPISAWEIGVLVAKGRLRLAMDPDDWFARLAALPGVRLAPLSPALLIASSRLPGAPPNDPADRIVAASARSFGLPIVTRDQILRDYARSGHVDVILC